ncbi:beta-lactamase-like protein [Filobasidium floriforme]|uniref:beta-lactamase-like protein n=1 Tax=Filobasidium floriforme TaxID=5210 RepID=UPI001E8D1C44|nr:beta-lactamase-like protein [Filobasidium floriforme]KAH8083637.1 beta-lactamase-like protein [Filobasidium floriforme]
MTTVQPGHTNPKPLHTLSLSADPSSKRPPLDPPVFPPRAEIPQSGQIKTHPSAPFTERGTNGEADKAGKARLVFVGTATCVLEWQGVRIMTDPNFLHAGDHVHLGPGVTGTRVTDPAFPIEGLPSVDVVVLSHFHADHFDQLVQEKLRKDLPIVTTRHAEKELMGLEGNGGAFTDVYGMDVWESTLLKITDTPGKSNKKPVVRVVATPGKHIAGFIGAVNDAILHAIPPEGEEEVVEVGYRIYISGDTLMVDDLKEIPARYPDVDLLLIHLGGTSIPGAKAPLLMVTMDGKQGIQLVRLISPKLTIPVHFDDYDVFASPRSDFEKEVESAGLGEKVLYLDRGDAFEFGVRGGSDGS